VTPRQRVCERFCFRRGASHRAAAWQSFSLVLLLCFSIVAVIILTGAPSLKDRKLFNAMCVGALFFLGAEREEVLHSRWLLRTDCERILR
jgi:hypothetical protein